METILVKIFAIALALSQVTTAPDAVKTRFDRAQDQAQVAQVLRAGCTHIKRVFDIEHIDLDDLIAIALDDPQAIAKTSKVFRGLNFVDLRTAYQQFCTDLKVATPAVDLGDVIDLYNKAAADLPDHRKLKDLKLPGVSVVLDGAGQPFAEVFEENQRRIWVPLADIPEHVQSSFIAAEDRRFYQHKGIDERGLVRAFVRNLARSGRSQGGSTITQQIVKNLLVGDDLTYERKIREIIVATRLERTLGKERILELYLNAIYFGRGAWGIEMAARRYFGKTAKELTVKEGALLAGLIKGPNHFSPDRRPQRARKRLAYVLNRLKQDRLIEIAQSGRGSPDLPKLIDYDRSRRDIGYHFVDQVARETRTVAGLKSLTAGGYTVRSTINQKLQRAVEKALQEGLSRYERNAGRVRFKAPETNLAKAIERAEADQTTDDGRPAWQRVLAKARFPLYDVHWEPAVVLEKSASKRGRAWRVGLKDGRVLPLARAGAVMKRKLALHDVVLVNVSKPKRKRRARAELRVRPAVQGAAIVVENKTGRILAMTGGFSYPLSQLNRATQAVRQPGSAIKPLSYLAALGKGLQPNTLLSDASLTLPPINKRRASKKDYWTPKNYGGKSGGVLTMRRALERSRNLATVHLLKGGIEKKPKKSLDRLCELAVEAKIYGECERYYPFVLGAQPARPIDIAAFYSAIANEGLRPTPYVVESIERDGEIIYRHEGKASRIDSVDRVAFYQLKTILQGVLSRGTARSIASLAPYVAGKTGTSDDANDAWFVGFTNDVSIAVWVGYDNDEGKRRTLGGGATGGGVAVPIFKPIVRAAWTEVAPKTRLAKPSREARRQLKCKSIGKKRSRRRGSECFRVSAKGRVVDTQYRLVSGESAKKSRYRKSKTSSRRKATRTKSRTASTKSRTASTKRVRKTSRRARTSRSTSARTPYSWNSHWRAQRNWQRQQQRQYRQTHTWSGRGWR